MFYSNLFGYGVVGIWALTAISVANHREGSSNVVYVCCIVAGLIGLSMAIRAVGRGTDISTRQLVR